MNIAEVDPVLGPFISRCATPHARAYQPIPIATPNKTIGNGSWNGISKRL
jgi:hypothetical protein